MSLLARQKRAFFLEENQKICYHNLTIKV